MKSRIQRIRNAPPFRIICATVALAAAIMALPLIANAQQTQTAPNAASAPVAKKEKKASVTIVKNGKVITKSWDGDSTDVDIDVSEIGETVRNAVRKAMKNVESFSMTSTNGNFSFSFGDGDGEKRVFMFNGDSSMKRLDKAMRKLDRIHIHGFGNNWDWNMPHPPNAPRLPKMPRMMMFHDDNDHEFSSPEARKLDAEADAMRLDADAMRKKAEGEAMIKEAEAMKKRAEAVRMEAKSKKKSDDAKPEGKSDKKSGNNE